MPRLRPLGRDEVPEEAREYFDRDVSRYGHVLGNTELYAYNVPVLRAMKEMVAAYGQTDSLPLALKSLLRTRVAVLNGCPF